MYFRLGGGTVKGISKPGWIVWSRVFVEAGKLKFDTGIGEVVELPIAETQDRWNLTTSQWPIMHAVLPGISRDQMMAKHQSNHIQVVCHRVGCGEGDGGEGGGDAGTGIAGEHLRRGVISAAFPRTAT